MTDGIFLRLYISAHRSGLVAALGGDLWTTFEAIATYMNKNGECFPSQDALASQLGVHRPAVSKRVQRLLEFRWQGRPIIEIARKRGQNYVYRILPRSGVAIFDGFEGDVLSAGGTIISEEPSLYAGGTYDCTPEERVLYAGANMNYIQERDPMNDSQEEDSATSSLSPTDRMNEDKEEESELKIDGIEDKESEEGSEGKTVESIEDIIEELGEYPHALFCELYRMKCGSVYDYKHRQEEHRPFQRLIYDMDVEETARKIVEYIQTEQSPTMIGFVERQSA